MTRIAQCRFGLAHIVIFATLWLGFTVLTYAAVSGGLTNASQERGLVVMTTLGSISGPMTGAICRRFQSCCLQASLSLLPYAAAGLLVGVLFQWLPLPSRLGWQVLRLSAWGLGWFVWFGNLVCPCIVMIQRLLQAHLPYVILKEDRSMLAKADWGSNLVTRERRDYVALTPN